MKKNLQGSLIIVLVCLMLLSLILIVQTQAAMIWTIEILDGGMGPSLKLDSNDNPHISYYGSGLNYAKWNGSAWNIERLESDTYGEYATSLALDSNDNPHISYYVRNSGLRFAEWTGSTWNIETVPSEGAAADNSLALDSDGNPHISYYDEFPKSLN